MNHFRKFVVALAGVAAAAAIVAGTTPNLEKFPDPTGVIATFDVNGATGTSNPFFQRLGTNGRSCATCHVAGDAMGVSAAHAQSRFVSSGGSDPLFAAVDGANCPDVTPGDPIGHSLVTNNGLIRIFLPVPTNAQFTITAVHDPYGCALVNDPATGQQIISFYRRPLPTTNLQFLSGVMFDGRETIAPLNNAQTFMTNLITDLSHQAIDATNTHAQAANPPTPDQVSAMVNFELGLFTAQHSDNLAGNLDAQGALGGPVNLSGQGFYPGINDSLGGDPNGAAFNPLAMMVFAAWQNLISSDSRTAAREDIAAGEQIFDTFPLTIENVKGLNDNPALPPSFLGTCTTCHDTPNVGNHSFPVPLDIGTSHDLGNETDPQIAGGLAQLNVPELPIFQVTCNAGPLAGNVFYTSDPGKALIPPKSGPALCSDVGRIKGPILRGLAARAPYFHNGAAGNLNQIVNFYNQRFRMGLTDKQKAQLVAFLNSL